MQNLILASLALSLALSAPALAGECEVKTRSVAGQKARDLALALRLADVAPEGSETEQTYAVPELRLTETRAYEDGLSRYSSQAPVGLAEAQVKLLMDALHGAGMAWDLGLGHSWATTGQVSCRVLVPAEAPVEFSCTLTMLWDEDCQ
jgi:hypothetical protein